MAMAAALAVAADLLFNGFRAGFNVSMFALLLAAVVLAKVKLRRDAAVFGFCALLFAILISWRDAEELRTANLFCVFLCVGGFMAVQCIGLERMRTVVDYLFKPIGAYADAAICALPTAAVQIGRGVRFKSHVPGAIFRGVLLSIPALLILGGLLAGADAIFRDLLARLFNFDAETIMRHFVWIAGSWIAVYSIVSYVAEPERSRVGELELREHDIRVGNLESCIVLGSIAALTFFFVVIQFGYLFGGHEHVLFSKGLTYAEYARSGFFELLAFCSLLLMLVLSFQAVTEETLARRLLVGVLAALAVVVAVSAMHRMRLYIDAYGLTPLRIYPSAFMIWLGAVFAWLAVCVVSVRRSAFATWSFFMGLAVVFALNIYNPDAAIARVNLQRKLADYAILRDLSADAVEELSAADDEQIRSILSSIRDEIASRDIREMNLSSLKASKLLPPSATERESR